MAPTSGPDSPGAFPVRVRLTGRLTLLRLRGSRFEVTTASSEIVRCVLVGGDLEALRELFGRAVAVNGTARLRPSGRLQRIDAVLVEPARPGDEVFSAIPSAALLARELQLPAPASDERGNWLAGVTGRWPGDESLDELLGALRELRGRS